MKRRKQFVALSLAAILAWGGGILFRLSIRQRTCGGSTDRIANGSDDG